MNKQERRVAAGIFIAEVVLLTATGSISQQDAQGPPIDGWVHMECPDSVLGGGESYSPPEDVAAWESVGCSTIEGR